MTESTFKPREEVAQHHMDHAEGRAAKTIENETSKLPSDLWLWAAVASMGVSLLLKASNKKDDSQFVGQWAAPLLLIGVYNKIVKVAGSDRESQGASEFSRSPRFDA